MKNPSTDIFQLIHALTKSEKRYFKLFATRHFDKDNQYLRLFESIERQLTYNEKLLVPHFSSKKSPAHFAVLKKQLYESILEALHRYDEFNNLEQQLAKGVHFCNLLLRRGLTEQCKKQIIKYKQLAYNIEKFELLIELIEIEKRLAAKLQYIGFTADAITQIHEEQLFCLSQIQTTGIYWLKSAVIYQMHYAKKIIPGKENTILVETITNPLFTDYAAATTFKSKLDHMQIQALNAFVNRDAATAFKWNAAFLQLMDEHVHLKQIYAERYFSALNNYLIDCLILQKHNDLLNGIATLRELPKMPEFRHIQHLDATVFRLSYSLEINYYVGNNNFTAAAQCALQIRKGINQFAEYIPKPNIITLNYLCAYTLFFNNNYAGCLDILIDLFNYKETDKVIDLYCDAKMMQILCHFQLGDTLLLDSLIPAFNRITSMKKIKSRTYSAVLKYIRQQIKTADKIPADALYEQLLFLSTETSERNTFNNFNYLYWLQHCRGLTPQTE